MTPTATLFQSTHTTTDTESLIEQWNGLANHRNSTHFRKERTVVNVGFWKITSSDKKVKCEDTHEELVPFTGRSGFGGFENQKVLRDGVEVHDNLRDGGREFRREASPSSASI
ncbi:hypothetical protein CRG98_022143 [Punica granatum]|uniref:Uncharacterized protein n=1 Tax=Punica granatum TaxID=22663 RepID=A0A2I0JMI4_PUNGR|nr:hypothetical protein CRG98_022143 [Punica granatum]